MTKPESNKPEFILCSAIEFNGNIISGYRHVDCINFAIKHIAQNVTRENSICGFLTSKNRFISREDAFKIAKERSQIWHKLHDGVDENILVSEDLY
jgi:uncharacterized membrane protein